MKMKMVNLVNAATAMRGLAQKELDIKTAYKVTLLIKRLDVHMGFHDEKIAEMLEKYCVQDGEGWKAKTPEDNREFAKARKELLELDVELEEAEKIVLKGSENITISAADMMALEHFISFDFEE